MNASKTARGLRFVLICLVLYIVGCPSSEEPDTDGEEVVEASSVDVDGLLLMWRSVDGSVDAVNLIDPTTGEASPFEIRHRAFALGPDAQSIAFVLQGGSVAVARFIIDENDLPSFEFVAQWDDVDEDTIRFTLEPGLWLGANTIYDANTGDHIPCELGDEDGWNWATLDPRCARVLEQETAYTRDGQFGPPGLTHLPSGVRLSGADSPVADLAEFGRYTLRLLDGRLVTVPVGVNGDYVVRESAGFRNVYKVETSPDRPDVVSGYRVDELFEAASADTEIYYELTSALQPHMTEGEGRDFVPVTVLPDGEIVYRIQSWVIESSESVDVNTLFTSRVHSALVAIGPDGETRSWEWRREDEDDWLPGFGRFENPSSLIPPFTHYGAVYLGEGDFLLPTGDHWVGSLEGERVAILDAGLMSASADWFVSNVIHDDRVPSLCFRPVEPTATRTCIPQPTVGKPVSIVARGIREDDGPAVITTLSKPSVWPGGEVVAFGSSFGASGDVRLGGEDLPAENIVEWTEHYVRFVTPEDMPEMATVEVVSADGGTTGRVSHTLHRTERISVAFADLNRGPHSLAQGLNLIDFGTSDFEHALTDDPWIAPEPQDERGTFVVYDGSGDVQEGVVFHTFRQGDYEVDVGFSAREGLADDTRWQPVEMVPVDSARYRDFFFTHLADSLVEVPTRRHPLIVDGRIAFREIANRRGGLTSTYGLPWFWRQQYAQDVAHVVPWGTRQLRVLLGYGEQTLEGWGRPDLADEPQLVMEPGSLHFDSHGDTFLIVGNNDSTPQKATYQFSRDGGRTLEPRVLASEQLGRENTTFFEPIAVERQGEPVFLVFENVGLEYTTHVITMDGTLEQDVAGSPRGITPLRPVVDGSEVVVYAQDEKTLAHIDLDSATPTWRVLPDEQARGQVVSWFHDPADNALHVVMEGGEVLRAESGNWTQWASFDLGMETVLDPEFRIRSIGKLPDGRWLVRAELLNASSLDWPFPDAAFFVEPMP